MRENPWHLRLPTTEHFQWFKNLVSLHEMTQAWLEEVQPDHLNDLFSKYLSPEVTENLWMLKLLPDADLDDFLDDTHPEDVLRRLEHSIWAVQAMALIQFQEKGKDPAFQEIATRLGYATVAKRWKKLTHLPAKDLRDILLAINDSPLSGYPHGNGFLVRRALAHDIQIELRTCPHQSHFHEIKPVADPLCRLHSNWIRGFVKGLHPQLVVEHVIQNPRCTQRWYLSS